MKKETDLGGVKAIAKTLLMTAVNQTPYSPILVQHPFTSTGLVALPTEKYEGFRPIDITLNEENLKRWRESVSQIIDETENPYHIYMLLNPPYALTFLKLASPYLSRKDFSEILASAWINCEAPHNDPELNKADLVFMFKSADPKALMEDDEYEQLQELDDTLTVYRGVTSYNADNVKALSWTLNKEKAEWFAHRFNDDGTVYEAQIDKKHIFAIFNGRNESEVVLDPQYLTDITEVQDMTSDFFYQCNRRKYRMNYKNEKHRELFGEAVRRKDKKDYELMSALYILTSDLRLWHKVKRYTEKSIIDFEHIRVKGIHPTG